MPQDATLGALLVLAGLVVAAVLCKRIGLGLLRLIERACSPQKPTAWHPLPQQPPPTGEKTDGSQ